MKRTKKEHGEGSITYQMRNGRKYFTGRYTIGYDQDGKQIRKSYSSYDKAKVNKVIKEKTLQIEQGLLSTRGDILFSDFYKNWLYVFVKPTVGKATFQKYEADYRLRILGSPLENVALSKISPLTIRNTLNYWTDTTSEALAGQAYGRVKTCIKAAIHQRYITTDPTLGIELKKTKLKKEKYKHYSLEQQEIVISDLNLEEYTPKDMLIYIYFASGIRMSEGLGLSWTDYRNGGLEISKQYSKYTEIDTDGNRKVVQGINELKTTASYRFVPLPENVQKKLDRYRKLQKAYIETCTDYKNTGVMFPNQVGGYMDRKVVQSRINNICKDNGIEGLSIHAIRHTYATRLFENGVPPKVVQTLLGHKSIKTTLDIYTHVVDQKASKEVDKLNGLF